MEILKKTTPLLLFLILLINSLGSISRWDLNEQIGMGDNLYHYQSLYPVNEDYSIFSIYTPGVALISYSIRTLGVSEYLAEIMLIIASLIVFLTFILFSKIIKLYHQPNKYFFEIQTIYTLTLCLGFVYYSTEFKPDAISFLMCFYGLYIYQKKTNLKTLLFGSILIASSILFKQQSIFFILGLILFSIFNLKNTRFLIFTFTSSVLFFSFTFYLFSIEDVYKFNYDVISDDGFQSVFEISKFLWDQFKGLILVFCIIFPLIKIKSIPKKVFFKDLNNPYFFIGICIMIGSFLSFLKNGGNTGNLQVGLFYCSLFLWIYFKKIEFKGLVKVICFLVLIISVDLGKILQYKEYLDNKKSMSLLENKNISFKILSDSHNYTISRHLLNSRSRITNFETLVHLNKLNLINKNTIENFDVILLKDKKEIKDVNLYDNKSFHLLKKTKTSSIYVKKKFLKSKNLF